MEEWKVASESNSPQSVRQAALLSVFALLLLGGLFALKYFAGEAIEKGAKSGAKPCRRA